jgi:glycosyltransferase involved in cell wall biosynthesis
MTLKLSIITVHSGLINELEKTIRSIYPKLSHRVEHIIVASISEEQLDQLIRIGRQSVLLVNKDRSLYDAMNIGLRRAQGQFVSFINSGDELSHEIPFSDLINNVCLAYTPALNLDNNTYIATSSTLNHQNFIAPHDEDIAFNEDYGIFSDALWMREMIQKHGVKYTGRQYATFYYGGRSTKPSLKQSIKNLRLDIFLLPRVKLVIKAIFVGVGLEWFNKVLLLKGYK